MPKSYIHKFRISGMYNSADVAAVRSGLVTLAGVGAVSVDLRKMEAQITATKAIGAPALRNALGNAGFELSGLTTSVVVTPSGVRDDEIDKPTTAI